MRFDPIVIVGCDMCKIMEREVVIDLSLKKDVDAQIDEDLIAHQWIVKPGAIEICAKCAKVED